MINNKFATTITYYPFFHRNLTFSEIFQHVTQVSLFFTNKTSALVFQSNALQI